MTKTMVSAAILATSLFLAASHAQAAANFSGEWKMNVAKSDFGQVPAPEVLTRSIQHHDPVLEYKSYQKGVQGEVTTEIKYTTDGKPCVNTVQDMPAKGTAHSTSRAVWGAGPIHSAVGCMARTLQVTSGPRKENPTHGHDRRTANCGAAREGLGCPERPSGPEGLHPRL